MAKDLPTNSSVEIVTFLADHLIVTTKAQRSLDTSKMKCCRFLYGLARKEVEYSPIMKVKLNPMLLQIHLNTLIIPKTRHLTVKTQSG